MAEFSRSKGKQAFPSTVRTSKEKGVTSMHPVIPAEKTNSKPAQMQRSNLLKDNARSASAKEHSSVKNPHLHGQQLQEPAMAAEGVDDMEAIELAKLSVHESCNKGQMIAVDAEMKVSSPVSLLQSFNTPLAVEKDKLNSLSDASAFLEQAQSKCQAPGSYGVTQQEQEQIDADNHQQIESSMGFLATQKARDFKQAVPETFKQDQLEVSVNKKMHSTGFNEGLKMQKGALFHDSTAKARQRELIVETEQSTKVADANIEDNIERPVQLLQSSAFHAQRHPNHQQSVIGGQRGFESLTETMAMQAIQKMAPSSLANNRHANYPQRQLYYPTNHLSQPSTDFQSTINSQAGNIRNNYINSNYLGYHNPAGELYTRTKFMNINPRAGYSVTTTDFNSPHYASHLYGLGNEDCSISSLPGMQLHDRRLSISSESPTLSSGTKSSPSRYGSPGSPYDAQSPVCINQLHAGAGLVSPLSFNTRHWSTKPASAHSPSSLAGTSSADRFPLFQLEDDVLIMDGVVIEKRSPAHHVCSDSTPPDRQQRAGKAKPKARFLGSPSMFLQQHSESTHLPDAQSCQMRSKDSLSRTREGSRSGARSENMSNAVEVHASECNTMRKSQRREHPEYSPEVVQALNLPANLDFLYETSPESTCSNTKQYEASSSSKSRLSFSHLSENASFLSSKSTPSPCKEFDSTAQSGGPANMVVTVPKSPAISLAKSSRSFLRQVVNAPPFIPTEIYPFSTKVETVQSPAKNSHFSPKTVARAAPHSPSKTTKNMDGEALHKTVKSTPFPSKEAQSPDK